MRESFQSTPSLTSLSSNQMLLVHNCALSQSEARSTWLFFAGGKCLQKMQTSAKNGDKLENRPGW